jgi:hypothetical protein
MATIVSGLPRSGTSLVMQMLQAGGFPILADEVRKADTDNPKGYLEWEPIKQLPENPWVIGAAEGKAVKVFSPWLSFLPPDRHYHVLFIERLIPEVIQSQNAMLRRTGDVTPISEETLERHSLDVHRWLDCQLNMRTLYLDYYRVLRDPKLVAKEIAVFLVMPLDLEEMVSVVDLKLYRHRAKLAHA